MRTPVVQIASAWQRPRLRQRGLLGVACAAAVALSARPAIPAEPLSPPMILQELRSFREMGSVLYIAAHPDDENTQLIAYFARGRAYRTAYLSVTRGDGGQNVLGPEFGEELGVARTQELLAARRIDGGRQFFTRAIDFGFSKTATETLGIWDRQQVVADIVRVMRTFRPDVVITRFSPTAGGTHGHHTASAVLGLEAFKLAGDAKAFPEQLPTLAPWQPKRILMNGRGGGADTVRMEAGGNDPVTGESFSAIAGRSRSMHKTQGFGNFAGGGRGGPVTETFELLAGEPATNDVFDGIDTTWGRVPGGAEVGKQADDVIAQFDQKDAAASVPALLKLRTVLSALPADPIVDEKRAQLDRILQACLGLEVETVIPQAEVAPGETLKLQHTVTVHSSIPVRWMGVRYPGGKGGGFSATELKSNQPATRDATQTLPAGTPLTQPYWLREEPGTGMYRVADASLIGRPENPPVFPVQQVFEVGGQTLVIPDEPVQITEGSTNAGARRRLDVIPPVSLKFVSEVKLFAPGSSRPVEVEVTAYRANSDGSLSLNVPAGWKVTPANQPFRLATVGEHKRFSFNVTAPAQSATAHILASAKIGAATYDNERIEIGYSHIPLQLLQPPARLNAIDLNLMVRGKEVGYLAGAGDSVAESLEQMGYEVTQLTGADLTTNRLKDFDAVVIGIRAFNVRTDLVAQLPALFSYVEAGGNVIEQYNRPGRDLKTEGLAPYSLRISDERVTDETATMTFLAPDHPVLNTPNKITSADFDGWIQERGIYFPNQWDGHFTPILACHDADEAPKNGSLLVAKYGKGYFVYTGLVFFRQLPAGVPGAYRLFANLVSLGK